MKSDKGTLDKRYGYGIVDKDNDPWWDEVCVAGDRSGLSEVVENLNDEVYDYGDKRRPYRVVELFFRETGS